MVQLKKYKFDEMIEVNGFKMDKHYLKTLSFEERKALIPFIVDILKFNGVPLPDDEEPLKREYERLKATLPDISSNEAYNNSSVATYICKYFCAKKFYESTEPGKKNIFELWQDEKVLESLVYNRLGMEWYHPSTAKDGTIQEGVNECFNLYMKMFIQGMRSKRLVPSITLFHPDIAKHILLKYSEDGDTYLDYSCGWGARMLAASVTNRKYIGFDPSTVPELINMKNYFDIQDDQVKLIQDGSENINKYVVDNSVDFCFSSPPYMIKKGKKRVPQEKYSDDESQAYSKGEDYFYNVYWKQTLENCKNALKPGKWFGLNMFDKETEMVDMARKVFGPEKEIFKLRTVKSHLSGKSKEKGNSEKFEPVYMFRNDK